jgi:hypothetical protein
MSKTFGPHLRALVLVLGICVTAGAMALVGPSAASATLPDGRAYELVSPVATGQEANVYIPGEAYENLSVNFGHGVYSGRPFEVASSGEAVAYAGEPPVTGGDGFYVGGEGNEFLSRRAPGGGWGATDLQVTALPGVNHVKYEGFSSDLSVGMLETGSPLAVSAPPTPYEDFYAHATSGGAGGAYEPFYTGTPPNRDELHARYAGANTGTSAVPANSHLLFAANDALLEGGGQLETELDENVKKEVAEGDNSYFLHNLYDSVNGKTYLVSVLPDGKTEGNASFGSLPESIEDPPGLTHVISADGSRIFWTAAPGAYEESSSEISGLLLNRSKALYVRENDTQPESPLNGQGECTIPSDACTVQVDKAVGGGGIFQTASADGSEALFTKGGLYEFDVENGQTTDLTPGVEVQGVLGTSENLEYIYYVDAGYELYLWHDGVSEAITQLSYDGDDAGVAPFPVAGAGGAGSGYVGDWQTSPGFRTAEVTPGGQSLVFMSDQSLTGYENEGLEEVFLYEVGTGLHCVSCNPAGEAPVATEFLTDEYQERNIGAMIPVGGRANYQPQVISDDGNRVFFDSAEPLVPQATNGWLNVYEWERPKSDGSCTTGSAGYSGRDGGCIYLLSSGGDPESSYLIGTDATGDNVFFVSRAQLLAQDRGDDDVVYDARVGGVQPAAGSACTGTGCQGVPPAPPIFATPSSVTFNGVGNFSPPPAAAKPKAKPVKCKKGDLRKKGKCVKRPKTKTKKAKKQAKGRK